MVDEDLFTFCLLIILKLIVTKQKLSFVFPPGSAFPLLMAQIFPFFIFWQMVTNYHIFICLCFLTSLDHSKFDCLSYGDALDLFKRRAFFCGKWQKTFDKYGKVCYYIIVIKI